MRQTNTHFSTQNIFHLTIILWLGAGMLFATTHLFAAPSATADKVKAAYIYQLTHFASWPNTPSLAKEVFTICVLGSDGIYNKLAPLNSRQEMKRTIKVHRPKALTDIKNCKILYIAKSEQHRLSDIIHQTNGKPILTVSSIPNFAMGDGIIGFVIIDNKIRLEINRNAAQRAKIMLSAKLLEIASLIRNGTPKERQP